ncbi:hypothetical protein ALC56_12143, partial [Trachymyrmex septentrionalis]
SSIEKLNNHNSSQKPGVFAILIHVVRTCHKRGVIYGVVDRIFRLCHPKFQQNNLINAINIFLKNGYPLHFIFSTIHNKRQLKTRLHEHISDINISSKSPSVISNMDLTIWRRIAILHRIKWITYNKRLISEIVHIKKQKHGINRQNDTVFARSVFWHYTFSFSFLISSFFFSPLPSLPLSVLISLFSFSTLRYSILWKSDVRYSLLQKFFNKTIVRYGIPSTCIFSLFY